MSKSMAITFLMPKTGSGSRAFSASKFIREILSRCATRRNSGSSLEINHLALLLLLQKNAEMWFDYKK
jgi:hypothetical protein